MHEGSFSRAIAAHLQLKERNSRLERRMPLDHYREQFHPGVVEPEPVPPVPLPAEDAPPARSPEGALRADAPAPYEAPWDDPDSWWNVKEQLPPREFDWRS
jgi:hypothetical protein